ncbi:hypothetical protein [Allosphingosinicella deserti]|uniref:hypothetical protein n=1 Tax=Allosphingosinicella deserti TaxID=2116704 RepID=UPI001304B703|nr:hypothetical protein [Sphingomonas deserti]
MQADLCERVRKIASQGATMPVATLPIGDPAILASEAVTLLVHASVRPVTGDRLLAFTVRPYRVSADQSGPFFGSAPRAVAMTDPAALDEALTEALSETLPWRPKLDGPRPLQ